MMANGVIIAESDAGGIAFTPQSFLDVVLDWHELSSQDQERFLDLHADTRPQRMEPIRQMWAHMTDGDGSALTPDEMELDLRILATFFANAFKLPTRRGDVAVVFPTISLIQHSCVPNATKDFVPEPNYLGIQALREINAGEQITLAYEDIYIPRAQRQANFKHIWGFECNCPACNLSDETVDSQAHEDAIAKLMRLGAGPHPSYSEEMLLEILRGERPGSLTIEELQRALDYSTEKAGLLETLLSGRKQISRL